MILTVNDLSFRYHSIDTLTNINFSVPKGKITVILGPNGVGKTTLLKCLNKILHPHNGVVTINNTAITDMTITDVAKQISYVAQKNDAARITVFDAVLMGRLPHTRYWTCQRDLEKVNAVIQHLNLSHMELKYLDQLSGGELQTVAIARALAQETDLLLLDEPTSSLDLKNQARILGLIRHIVHDHQLAAVMTMHDLNAALRYADHYIFLKDNTIFGTGAVKEICPEMVERVYGIKVDIVHHKGFPLVVPMDADEKAA